MNKDLERLVSQLRQQDFKVRLTQSNRLVVTKGGKMVVTISLQSGDIKAPINNLRRLARAGFKA